MADLVVREERGVIMALGARLRPKPLLAGEDRYAARLVLPVGEVVDFSIPQMLSRSRYGDARSRIRDQGGIGSCAANAAETAAETSERAAGATNVVLLHPGWLYYNARLLRGWQNDDAGSYAADNLDILRNRGGPRLDLAPYVMDVREPYHQLDADAANQRYVLTHRPAYVNPADPEELLRTIWLGVRAQMSFEISAAWLTPWFNAQNGLIDTGASPGDVAGGHAFAGWGIWYPWVLCAQSWSERWSPNAPSQGMDLRPGDFAIHVDYFKDPNVIWEARFVEATAAPVPPDPVDPVDPTPPDPVDPDPGPVEDWRVPALARIDPAVERLRQQFVAAPRSTRARFQLQGAEQIRAVVTA